MSSLPQGWHCVPRKNSLPGAAVVSNSSVSTTIRKKWNSPLSTEVPKSKLPSYRSSTLRLQNTRKVNGTVSTVSAKASPTTPSNLPCPERPLSKEYQSEITKLKKELATMKAENSILKAKVRRVDDENSLKSRQIEKLRAELKALRKNEASNSNKSKESELHLLRQKCLRLEGSLKEKDLALKKISFELSMKNEGSKSVGKGWPLRSSVKNVEKTDSQQQKSTGKDSSLSAQINHSRVSQSLKSEVAKFRDMIHKLEKENQQLQLQVKDFGQANRRLQMQLKSKDRSLPQLSAVKQNSKNILKPPKCSLENHVPNNLPKFSAGQKCTVPNQKPISNLKAVSEKSAVVKEVQSRVPCKGIQTKMHSEDIKNKKRTSIHAGKRSVEKQTLMKFQPSDPESTFVVANPVVCKSTSRQELLPSVQADNDLERRIKEMRENIAAKKIQQGWRSHYKRCRKKIGHQNEERALTFIISSVKHHVLRKGKLNELVKKKECEITMKNNEDAYVQVIQAAAQKIWSEQN